MSAGAQSTAAPWRNLFISHIGGMDSPEFTLCTLHRASAPNLNPNPSHSSSSSHDSHRRHSSILSSTPIYYPRARTCIFRGLWAELPTNPKNETAEAYLNPAGVWESDLLTFTTDARMGKMAELWWEENDAAVAAAAASVAQAGLGSPTTDKVGEELWEEEVLTHHHHHHSQQQQQTTGGKVPGERNSGKYKGSGGGAPVEAVFWARKNGVQWRVRGRAYVLAPDVETSVEGREVIALLRARMRRTRTTQRNEGKEEEEEEKEREWSFAREITAHFGNLSPMMRGSFRGPSPGRPVSLPEDEGLGLGLGQKVTDLWDPVARSNFRVVVIVPDELDQTDLSDPSRPRRWIHTFVGGDKQHGKEDNDDEKEKWGVVRRGEWETVEVWP